MNFTLNVATSAAQGLLDEQELAIDDQQGWASWAWSYVPALLPAGKTFSS